MTLINALTLLTLTLSPFTLASPITTSDSSAAAAHELIPRVTGGRAATPGQFPFIVAPQVDGKQWCGGTLLNAYTVLTAAHCSFNVPIENATIRAGSVYWQKGGTVVKVKAIKTHPSWKATVGQNDVALWHLASPIKKSSKISYARLTNSTDATPGLQATTAGWGFTSQSATIASPNLSWVDVPILARSACSQYGVMTDKEICAGGRLGKGSCPNDSGSPIWDKKTKEILGTVHSGGGCGLKDVPIVYTNLGQLRGWILENVWTS